jgi:hypothetical protein
MEQRNRLMSEINTYYSKENQKGLIIINDIVLRRTWEYNEIVNATEPLWRRKQKRFQ